VEVIDCKEDEPEEVIKNPEKKKKIAEGSQSEGWWDGPERYQFVNRNPITGAQRDAMFRAIAALAPGSNGWDIGGPGFEEKEWGIHCKGLNIVGGKDLTCDAMDLPFEDNSVDYLVSSHTIEHIIDVKKAFNEWVRVLKPGGIMAHKMPDKRYFLHDNANPNHTQPELAPNEMTADEMLELLREIENLEILLFNTHQNNFDFEILARKSAQGDK
jgi:predicted SAM-dependent methyltransferase